MQSLTTTNAGAPNSMLNQALQNVLVASSISQEANIHESPQKRPNFNPKYMGATQAVPKSAIE